MSRSDTNQRLNDEDELHLMLYLEGAMRMGGPYELSDEEVEHILDLMRSQNHLYNEVVNG